MKERMLVVPNTLCPATFSTFPISETRRLFQPTCTHSKAITHNQASKQAASPTQSCHLGPT